jgi:citrate synthase
MENLLDKIEALELEHDKLDPELIEKKRIKLGLRNPDGTGVVAGITTKGQVKAFKRDQRGRNVPIPGKLFYCGYDVEDIVANLEAEKRFGFEEIAFLLLTGELPTPENLDSFSRELGERRFLPDMAKEIIKCTSENDDLMGALHAAVSILHKFDSDPRSTSIKDVTRQCIDLIAKFPTIIAYNYHVLLAGAKVKPLMVEPRKDLSTAQNFLYMLQGNVPDDLVARTFDIALVLHAEHGGGNNSTFTVRTVSSSLTDTYLAMCAGLASLAGHLHGGANEAVMRMMEDIKEHVRDWKDDDQIYSYLEDILEKKQGDGSGKIYGVGHAVYTISDPRTHILKQKAALFAEKKERTDEFELYNKIAEIAVRLVKEKKGKDACVNVDFYSGFLYDMLGIPQELFTPVFALARVAGWSAHRIEEIIQGRLIRPAYVNAIKDKLKYIPIQKR